MKALLFVSLISLFSSHAFAGAYSIEGKSTSFAGDSGDVQDRCYKACGWAENDAVDHAADACAAINKKLVPTYKSDFCESQVVLGVVCSATDTLSYDCN